MTNGPDPRPVFTRTVALTASVMEQVPPPALHAPTPAGMDVRALLEHLVMVLRRVAAAGRGESPETWPIAAPDVEDDGFAAAFSEAADMVRSAWADDAILERPTDLPWGTFSGREVLGVYTNELVVHTWDLARGIGSSPDWDDEIVALADRAIRAQLPTAQRDAMWAEFAATLPPEIEWEAPFADAVDVPADAAAIDRLVAWNGRVP